jgi:hypothetical protein
MVNKNITAATFTQHVGVHALGIFFGGCQPFKVIAGFAPAADRTIETEAGHDYTFPKIIAIPKRHAGADGIIRAQVSRCLLNAIR